MTSGRIAAAVSAPDSSVFAFSNMWSRSSVMISFGFNTLPVFHAGQADWQRPHSVHVERSSKPFQVRSSTLPTPKLSSSRGFSKSIG